MAPFKWCSADVLICLTPLLLLEFNIARLALGLCDGDELALDCMYVLLKSLPGEYEPTRNSVAKDPRIELPCV